MDKLIKKGFNKEDIVSFGNMFLIGNGKYGYRGTLEEYSKDQMVGLNVVGFYDRYKKLWRESINLPNPFYLSIKNHNILNDTPIEHEIILNIKDGTFNRITKYDDIIIKSTRFISFIHDDIIFFKYEIKGIKDTTINLEVGTDINIYEINGPHFKRTKISHKNKNVIFKGITNENKKIMMKNHYIFPKSFLINSFKDGIYNLSLDIHKDKKYCFYCFSVINKDNIDKKVRFNTKSFADEYKLNKEYLASRWEDSKVIIKGNKEAQDALDYSIYHLLILANINNYNSIPARGVSGQTYKGAIFWDTEIFMLPFYSLTYPQFAKNLLIYRINSLKGALNKAKENGYDGAFYAWESQDDGIEACSKYNVTDPITNKPLRTYFDSKQIHISADIAYAFFNYLKVTNNYDIIDNKALLMLENIADFYLSYAQFKDNKYHLLDVIGPDEYHVRIDDNAFTNYLVYDVIKNIINLFKSYHYKNEKISKYQDFLDNLYLPEVNDNLIEQFTGYHKLPDLSLDELKKRLKHPNEYFGFVARNSKIIKQADVITLLTLLPSYFDLEIAKANFDYYYKNTEHGSSLSSSMYSIVASKIGYSDIAYDMFIKSASIDLGTNQKMYAGGIYIGGTHPASNAGAYLSLIFGMAGLSFENDKIKINPCLPKQIKGLEFNIYFQDNKYRININKKEGKVIKL